MIKNKLFIKYIGLSTIYICFISLFMSYTDDVDYWFVSWFSDNLFSFQTAIIYLLGCSLINEQYGYSAYHRHSNKKAFIYNHITDYYILSFIITVILFVCIIILIVIFDDTMSFDLLIILLTGLIKNLLGLCLIGIASLNFLYSKFNKAKGSSLVITYLIFILEIKVINPSSSSLFGIKFFILFSWIFFFNDIISHLVTLTCIIILSLILLKRIKRVDLIK